MSATYTIESGQGRPGYDFGEHESVTAQKLRWWLEEASWTDIAWSGWTSESEPLDVYDLSNSPPAAGIAGRLWYSPGRQLFHSRSPSGEWIPFLCAGVYSQRYYSVWCHTRFDGTYTTRVATKVEPSVTIAFETGKTLPLSGIKDAFFAAPPSCLDALTIGDETIVTYAPITICFFGTGGASIIGGTLNDARLLTQYGGYAPKLQFEDDDITSVTYYALVMTLRRMRVLHYAYPPQTASNASFWIVFQNHTARGPIRFLHRP